MEIAVCVKRVPLVGGKIVLTADGQDVDTRMSGFTVSPHEECAVEEAVQIVERLGGSVTVLTLGPPEAADQLRDMLALGASRALLLETGDSATGGSATGGSATGDSATGGSATGGSATRGREWGPIATAAAIAAAARRRAEGPDGAYDLLLFGNEAADTGDYQVAVRVAAELGLPCVTGIKKIEITGSGVRASRDNRGTQEVFDIPLPAVISVREGINLPRYPSLPGRLRAKRAAIEAHQPPWQGEGLRKTGLRVPAGEQRRAEILGAGPDAVPALVRLLDELGLLW